MDFITAMDNKYNTGENGHTQLAWNNNINNFNDELVKLSFQTVRGSNCDVQFKNLFEYALNKNYVDMMLSFVLQTRDIKDGKGEYQIFYNYLNIIDDFCDDYPYLQEVLPKILLRCLFQVNQQHSYGSCKDIKYIFNTFKKHNKNWKKSFILRTIVDIVINNIHSDHYNSMLAKWLPRENSKKFGWQAKIFAHEYCKRYRPFIYKNRRNNIMKIYRRMLASKNIELSTVQVKQCANKWSTIDFDKDVTSITLSRQRNAFLCKGKNKEAFEKIDRIICRENFQKYIEKCSTGEKTIKSKRVDMGSLVKDMIHCNTKEQLDFLNMSWDAQDIDCKGLKNAVAMVDLSASMTWQNCPYYNAIALGLRVAENSTFNGRLISFASKPSWINMDGCNTFSEKINRFVNDSSNVGYSTNFYSAIKLIMDRCVEADIHPSIVSNITLYVFSDMQINSADQNWKGLMNDGIIKMCNDYGMKTTHKAPYSPPNIVYWNMRSTNGFPCTSVSNGVIMLSGYSMSLLRNITKYSLDELKAITPYKYLYDSLNVPRYNWFWKV